MKDVLKIKPVSADLIVRDPKTKTPLAKEGEIKPVRGIDGRYWRRRLIDGSVIEVTETKVERPKEGTGTTQKKYKFGGKEK